MFKGLFNKDNWTKENLIMVAKIGGLYSALFVSGSIFVNNYSLSINANDEFSKSCFSEVFYLVNKVNDKDEQLSFAQLGNIVEFNSPEPASEIYGRQVVMGKQIMAVEGDVIEIKNHKAYINGKFLSEKPADMVARLKKAGYDNLLQDTTYTLQPGEFFVSGGNPEYSFDSRFWGPAKVDSVTGKVVWKGVTWE